MARSKKTVITATEIPIMVSAGGILPMRRKLHHSNVPITTINITPTNTAMGICSIKAEPTKIKDSKNKAGRLKIVKTLSSYGNNAYLKSRDDECWTLYDNTGDTEEFKFLTEVGEFALPAKIRMIPIQRSKTNILLSQQSLRSPDYGINISDSDGISDKLTRLYRSMMAMFYSMASQKYYQIEMQLKTVDQQLQQMYSILQNEPQTAEEAQQQAQIKEQLPMIEYQINVVTKYVS